MKHNKKRNTAFIYETLSRELTKAIVGSNPGRKNEIVKIVKEFFGKETPLAAELRLYNVLLETANLTSAMAEKMLAETKRARREINEESLFDEKSRIIAAINKSLGQEAWATFVPNFKALASVNAIFNKKTAVKKRVLFEQAVVNRMSSSSSLEKRGFLEPLDSLAYNSFIKKFNNTYSDLLQEQKDLLNQYITSFSDNGFELRVYLNEELSRLKTAIRKAHDVGQEPVILEKLNSVTNYLEDFRKREFTDLDLKKILKTQQLVQELALDDKN